MNVMEMELKRVNVIVMEIVLIALANVLEVHILIIAMYVLKVIQIRDQVAFFQSGRDSGEL